MSTKSIAQKVGPDANICQGDVFSDVSYNYLESQNENSVEIIEFKFPMAVIISQACDVNSMGEMVENKEGKSTKFMPSILMCPVYDVKYAKANNHVETVFTNLEIKNIDGKNDQLFSSKEFDVAKNDWHYRYHSLEVLIDSNTVLENAMIDFKHYFTVPASYLMKHRNNRLFHIQDLFAEQITLKFATYLSRVAIP